ncbi:MAG: hypothetical protein A2Y07_06610 [Planctomycetes bacterium GWF2_50_10]|nr:MAG: hypothetical protein A2Y07_06610 [Planctomycetes bacterium GWF2_50_10]
MIIRNQKINQGQLRGVISAADAQGREISTDAWQKFLAHNPDRIQRPDRVLKREGKNSVFVKERVLTGIDVVVKTHVNSSKFEIFKPARAFKNYRTAARLNEFGVACEYPLGGLIRRGVFFRTASVYLTQYVNDSDNLKNVLKAGLHFTFKDRRSMAGQMAEIFAGLHRAGYWHRDAKNTNMLVSKDANGFKVQLIDLDGVHRYLPGLSRLFRYRAMVTLAASLLPFKQVTRTDYLRCFTLYCNLTGLGQNRRKDIFRELAGLVQARSKERQTRYGY